MSVGKSTQALRLQFWDGQKHLPSFWHRVCISFFLVCSVLSSYSFLLCCFEEPPRRDLNHDFKNLARRNRDGSFATQHDREVMLTLIANPLHEGGFGHLRATGVRSKHVEYLVERWHKEGIGTGTFKNWMSDCRSSLKRSARCWMMPSSWWRQ